MRIIKVGKEIRLTMTNEEKEEWILINYVLQF